MPRPCRALPVAGVLAVLALAPRAGAEAVTDASRLAPVEVEPSARTDHPLAVRGEMNLLYDGVFGSTDGFAGATVAYSLDRHVSIEGTFGWGFGNLATTGANVILMGRYAIPFGRAGVHALTFALGPSTFFGGDYGTTWVARGEVAYELRTRAGFSLLVGAGPSLVLADSRVVHRDCGGWALFCASELQFKAGDVPLQLRAAAGWAF